MSYIQSPCGLNPASIQTNPEIIAARKAIREKKAEVKSNAVPYVPTACGTNTTEVYLNPTSRAARKARKGPSIFSGQAQSTRINSLKNCITQVNTSEIAYNQVVRQDVTRTIEYNIFPTKLVPTVFELQPPSYNDLYVNARKLLTNIVAYDPSENLYSLVCSTTKQFRLTRFPADGSLTPVATGPALTIVGTLKTANLFWSKTHLIFVGIFYDAGHTFIEIYTYDTPTLTASKALLNGTLTSGTLSDGRLTLSSTKVYDGESTCNSDGFIYIALASSSATGFDSSPVYYINSASWAIVGDTSLRYNYANILQCAGDAYGGAFITGYQNQIPADPSIVVSYFSKGIRNWTQGFPLPQIGIPIGGSAAGIAVLNNAKLGNLAAPPTIIMTGDFLYTLHYNDNALNFCIGFYNANGYTYYNSYYIQVTWPNEIPYNVLSLSVTAKQTSIFPYTRIFYTMYLYNPTQTNYQYYIQDGELDPFYGINPYTAEQIWVTNTLIGPTFNISANNRIQASANFLAISSGLIITSYNTTEIRDVPVQYTDVSSRPYTFTEILLPGNCKNCTLPESNIEPISGLAHVLKIAICQPITYVNPVANDDCAPVYTAQTQYLTPAQGAEPPLGPASPTITRRYDRINGIDEICRPIPGRYGSSWTARVRTNIVSASNTRYVNTDLPIVPYPFPCPVYGNQAGIPVASLCRPTIDGRPTNGIPS
jgi:hypothetical protein